MAYSFSVFCDGMKVAAGWCPSFTTALSVASRYAWAYQSEGNVVATVRRGRKQLARFVYPREPIVSALPDRRDEDEL